MKTITPREYELFRQFIKFFKDRTDTDLSNDFLEWIGGEVGQMDETAIINIACAKLNLAPDQVISKSRKRELVEGRGIITRILRNRGLTQKSIGLTLGGRDHSTVIHSLSLHDDLMQTDSAYREKFNTVADAMIK